MGLLNATHIYSAAAPISVDIITWFQKLGISVIQGYAMTEDFVYGHFEFPGSKCLGSVGKAVPGLQVKFSEQDELLVKSIGLLDEGAAVLSRLTSSTAWWVQTDAPEGMKLLMRRKLEKTMEGDFETDSMRYKATERYQVGFTDWRAMYGTPGV